MGGGQFYLYMYGLLCVAVSFVLAIGTGLVLWGRRRERRERRARVKRIESTRPPKDSKDSEAPENSTAS